MKYVYIWFVKMTEDAFKKNLADGKFFQNWAGKAKDVLKKHGMKVIIWGSPYYTVEQIAIGVETDAPLDEFSKVAMDLYHIDPSFIDYAKTMIIGQ